jgi:hypothetical protein
MLKTKAQRTLAALIVGATCLAAPVRLSAVDGLRLAGAITGVVNDPSGVPQMGATVQLLNRQDRPFGKVLTDGRGEFQFFGLLPDVYSIRVTLAAFVPALRKDILVQPGMRSVLSVNLNTLFSTIQLAYPPFDSGVMADDWKWVLRSASATRPVLRFSPSDPTTRTSHASVFSETRGIVQVSAGDGVQNGSASQADLGTAFALATSLYGTNNLQVSGNLGYGSETGMPATAFRTSYSRNIAGSTPVFSVTVRQLLLPGRLGGNDGATAALRSLSSSFDNQVRLSDKLTLKYGTTLESISFLERSSYISPYARLSYAVDGNSELDFVFTRGNARPDLAGSDTEDAALQKGLDSLGLFPRLSIRNGQARAQQGEEFEATYVRRAGSRTFNLTVFHEQVRNAALSLVAPESFYGGDILPDMFSGNATFNAGDYQSMGYTASVTQDVGRDVSATVMYGTMGELTADGRELVSTNPDNLRSMIHAGRKHAATLRLSATSPWTGTRIVASYQWTPDGWAAMPGNLYSTQAFRPMPGLNLYFRQPIPGFPRRVEATADLRNMLAQGYLPLGVVNGQRVMLVQTPRSFRGGLAFIF